MISYLDTSALVKLYVLEDGTDVVQQEVKDADVVASSRVAYPEARAAFARRQREGSIAEIQLRKVVRALNDDFDRMLIMELTESAGYLAGDLAELHGLRGFDAVHLAAARELWSITEAVPRFCCFDGRLLTAAAGMGMIPVPPDRE